ncbi:MAG: catechol 2,3-dioxygenase [Candidatus Poribacteria bacterium]|nr:catechol 2,3-dioxygenase [Candidatus Poribacteria bacterium]
MSSHRSEPLFDVAQLAHIEIYTPKLEASVNFFKAFLGMQETERSGQSVYLRGFEEWYHHSLKVTEAKKPGFGHVGWRTTSEKALQRRVKAIKTTGLGKGWIEGDLGHGRAYQFTLPDGHLSEVFWDVGKFVASEEQRSKLLNRPQKRPLQGIPVSRLDHFNLLVQHVKPNKDFMVESLGFKVQENIVMKDGEEIGSWLSIDDSVHDIAMLKDPEGASGRLHHITFWYRFPSQVDEIADVAVEYGIPIITQPGQHGIARTRYIYLEEPGGNLVELGQGGYEILDPDWTPITWGEEDLSLALVHYGASFPEDFLARGTPPV